MKNKTELENLEKKRVNPFAEISDKAKNLAIKAQDTLVNAVDKNGNGKIDAEDFGLTKENIQTVGLKIKNGAIAAQEELKKGQTLVGKAVADAKTEMEKNALRPVFPEDMHWISADIDSVKVQIPRLLNIVPRDKKHEESILCAGSVGYWNTVKGVEILNLYEDKAPDFGLEFFPNLSQKLYLADPCKFGLYVALGEYFEHLKKARVSELELIAQSLGAKHFEVIFKEHRQTKAKKEIHAEAKCAAKHGEVSRTDASADIYHTDIAADVTFCGNDQPKMPELTYFKNESAIESLIQMRINDKENKIQAKTYHFQCSSTTGITEKEAAKLDAMLAQIKHIGKFGVSQEVQRENRTELEYKIEF